MIPIHCYTFRIIINIFFQHGCTVHFAKIFRDGTSGLDRSGLWLQMCLSCLPPFVVHDPAGLRHLPKFQRTQMSSLKR